MTELVFLIACVACAHKANIISAGAVTVELTSNALGSPIPPGSAAIITATIFDQNNQGVTWSIAPLDFGTLSSQTSTNQASNYETVASVTYTAPSSVSTKNSVTITATSITNPNISTSVQFQILPTVVSLSIFNNMTGQSFPAAPRAINQGDQLFLLASVFNQSTAQGVTWSLSPGSGGSLVLPTPSTATFVASTGLASPLTVTVTATSISDSNATASVSFTVFPSGAGPNVAAVNVDGGPVPGQVYENGAFTSVTLCNPGDTVTCQTVGGILVDTGSYGLRVLQSQIPLLKLTTLTDGSGSTLQNCASLVDGSYLWGPVSRADLYIGGEFASSLPLQVIATSVVAGAPLGVPNGCSNGGTDANTPQLLGANGILGVGPEPTDCTLAGVNYCDATTQSTPPNLYYSCSSIGCGATDSPVTAASTDQVANPVAGFNGSTGSNDTGGVILQLPDVSRASPSLIGELIFGINSTTNNALGSATVFTLDANDHFTTLFNGQSLTGSFIDSGSSALYFPDSLPICTVHTQLFCPLSAIDLSAVNTGATSGQNTVAFTVDNADSLFANNPGDAAFNMLAGPERTFPPCAGGFPCAFDWGLPFFFGRAVYVAIDTRFVASAPKPPWWAY